MSYFTPHVPSWVSILFLIVIPIPIFLIAGLVKKGNPGSGKRKSLFVLTFYIAYFFYVGYACFEGWFEEIALPPVILKYTMVPLLLFLMVVVYNLPITKRTLNHLQLYQLVRIHLFRLIGSFFLILGLYKALPSSIAIIAGCGDVITAVSSIFVAKALVQKKESAKKLCWAWNTFGLVDILATSASAFILTKISIETGAQGVDVLGQFPFCFIPAFAPATIIFLHFLIYRKLLMERP